MSVRDLLCVMSVLLLGLTGCATPYQPRGMVGGYTDQDLGNDRFLISVLGNGYTTVGEVTAHFHRRAGEIVQARQYSSYVVESLDARIKPWVLGPRPQADGIVQCTRANPRAPETERGTANTPLLPGGTTHGQQAGAPSTPKPTSQVPAPAAQPKTPPTDPTPIPRIEGKAHRTKIDDVADDVVVLRNGAVVQVVGTSLTTGRDAILYNFGGSWRLWIENKRAYRCEVLKEPIVPSSSSITLSSIDSVTSDGRIVTLLDGSIWEVSSLDRIATTLWLPFNEVIVIDDAEIAAVDDGTIATVTRLK